MQSSSRNGAKVRLLVVHTTEGIMRADALRKWTSWAGSSHAASDETGALMGPEDGFVPYDRAAWTLRSGNPVSDNIEQCGWARWTRDEWLARPKLLDATARWLAERSKARGIPLIKLSPAQVRVGAPGVCGHVDWTVGMNDGSHTDPGKNYPWDVVLKAAVAYAGGGRHMQSDPAPADTPAAPKEYTEMKIIQAPGRGAALVGAGYYRQLLNDEDFESAKGLWGTPVQGNPRQFDLWVAQATQGVAAYRVS